MGFHCQYMYLMLNTPSGYKPMPF